ncbi:uncharacterized protein FFB14_07099 [Fusarium fujikuroi]|nr:uncharacterized protein FFB14_07099 [Fusarium fujikuroi]
MSRATFHPFPNLPVEIRLQIWEDACFDWGNGRFGLHYIKLNENRQLAPLNCEWQTAGPRNRSAYLWHAGLWTACKESRDVAAKHWSNQGWPDMQENTKDKGLGDVIWFHSEPLQAETLLDAATKSRDNNLLQSSNSAALANKIQELESQLQQAKVQLEESQAEERRVQAQISDLHFMLEYGDWYAFLLKAMRPHESTIEQDDAVNKIRPLPLSAFHDHTTQARVSGTAQAEAENRQYTGPNDEQKKPSLKSSKTFSQTRKGLQDGTVLMGGKQHRHMR